MKMFPSKGRTFALLLIFAVFTFFAYLLNIDGRDRYVYKLVQKAAFRNDLMSEAPELTRVRLACIVVCRKSDLDTKVKAVNVTWARRCDKMLYVMTWNVSAPDILAVSIPDTYHTLNTKIVYSFTHLYNTLLNDFDWFLKADDDTYVIVENLKSLLSQLDKNQPVALGDHFRHFSPNGFLSGGAGYVLSQAGLRRLVEHGYQVPGRCWAGPGKEDVQMGRCLAKAGVFIKESIDISGKGTFHAASPREYLGTRIPQYLMSQELYQITPVNILFERS